MATATHPVTALLTMEQYLQTSYEPDCEFLDGILEERNVGETQHSLLQVELAFWFRSHKKDWAVRALTESRTRVSPTRVRLPDVSVVHDDEALREPVRVTPPLIAMEILSPEDRMPRVILRLKDLLSMGVPHVWLFDPLDRVAYTYTASGLRLVEENRMTVPGSPIYVDLFDIFAALD